MRIFLILILILLSPLTSWGANCGVSPAIYYVDYSGSHGTGTISSPWKYAPGSSSNTCTPQAGDVIIFKGGVSYQDTISHGDILRSTIDLVSSGNATNSIIYDGDSGTYASRWASGTAKAIIDLHSDNTVGVYFTGAYSYIVINNFEFKDGYAYGTGGTVFSSFIHNWTGSNLQHSNYVTISNSVLHDTGSTEPEGPIQSGGCIRNGGGDYWIMDNLYVTNCGCEGIDLRGTQYNVIRNSKFCDPDGLYSRKASLWVISLGLTYWEDRDMVGNEIYNNVFADCNRNVLSISQHGNWIYVWGQDGNTPPYVSGGKFQDLKIYNNTFYNTYSRFQSDLSTNYTAGQTTLNVLDSSNVQIGEYVQIQDMVPIERRLITGKGTGTISILTGFSSNASSGKPAQSPTTTSGFINLINNLNTTWTGIYIYNNVMYNPDHLGIAVSPKAELLYDGGPWKTGSLNGVYIYGNSCWTADPLCINLRRAYAGTATSLANIYIKNNTVQGIGSGTILITYPPTSAVSGTYSVTNNNYYGTRSEPLGIGDILYYPPDTYNFTNFKAQGLDNGTGDSASSFSNSLFTNVPTSTVPGISTMGTGFNLRPQVGSPLINKGASLGSPYNTDILGNSRPIGSYDVGAYEYGLGIPSAVQGLTITGGTLK